MGQEIFPIMRGGAGMGQEKSMRGGDEDPILRPRSAPLPSLPWLSCRESSQTIDSDIKHSFIIIDNREFDIFKFNYTIQQK